MAAPHIAGIVAQLFQADPTATPGQVEDAIKSTAHKYSFGAPYEAGPLGTTSFDKGYGLVDAVAAAEALAD
jgi:serine protease AprX